MQEKYIKLNKLFFSIVLFLTALAGCSVQNVKSVEEHPFLERTKLPEGAWMGEIAIVGVYADDSNKKKDGDPLSGNRTFIVMVCDGKGIFWHQRDNGDFYLEASEEKFGAHSNLGNHLIYFQNFDHDPQPVPGWVETQTMLLVERESGTLRAQWVRAVSNPLLLETDRERDFFWHGIGTLKRIATYCPKEIIKGGVKK